MNNQDIVKKIIAHQNDIHVHPLTCGNNSSHRLLHAAVREENGKNKVILVCDECDYEQNHIPSVVLNRK